MSIFGHRKPPVSAPARDALSRLRETLDGLKAEPQETPQIAGLKRILVNRIAEMDANR